VFIGLTGLAIPATINAWALGGAHVFGASSMLHLVLALAVPWLLLAISAALIAAAVIVALATGCARLLRQWLARAVPESAWLVPLYAAASRMLWASLAGGSLWLAWMWLCFEAHVSAIAAASFLFGTAGHLLGAWVYLPLLYRWYALWRTSRVPRAT
jgi:hypothetical protein